MSSRPLARAALLTLLLGAAGCDGGPSEAEIREEIELARRCQNDHECINLGSRCPIGCAITVNRSEAERILGLLRDLEASCTQDCSPVTRVVCEKSLCTAK
jgi:hypothetical protein